MNLSYELVKHVKKTVVSAISTAKDIYGTIFVIVEYRVGIFPFSVYKCNVTDVVAPWCCGGKFSTLRGCPCKDRPLDFRPKTKFLQIFRVRQLVHMINKKGNNLAFISIFQYFWRQFQRTVQNR